MEPISKVVLKERVKQEILLETLEDVKKRANSPQLWIDKLKTALSSSNKPSLKHLQQILTEVKIFFFFLSLNFI